jgi:hypothetical protein
MTGVVVRIYLKGKKCNLETLMSKTLLITEESIDDFHSVTVCNL